MRLWLGVLWLGALCGIACAGTEGTLLVLHDSAGASGAAGAASAASGTSGAAGSQMAEKPYVPAPDVTWQAKLSGPVDITEDAQLFYLDADLQDPVDLQTLRAEGRHYLCYLSAGSLETFRDDAEEFPAHVIGRPLADFPEERWLDVRAPIVRELMALRIEALAAAGCDGIPPSSLAVHAADTGFELTLEGALDYARWFAERIHAAGMSAGLTGPASMTGELWPTFDFGLAIGCLEGTECAEFGVFKTASKPVLHLELGDEQNAPGICKHAETLGFVPLVTNPSFNGQSVRCRDIL
jgi:hypothetical protein